MPLDDIVREVLQETLTADEREYAVLSQQAATFAIVLAERRADLRVRSRRIAAVRCALDADDLELLGADGA